MPCQVLMGMGGVGKTQLAVDYAEQAWDSGQGVDLLVWVTASSRDAIVAAFGRAGAKLCGGGSVRSGEGSYRLPGMATQRGAAVAHCSGRCR